MQEIWVLQRLWGYPLGRNPSVGNQNIYNGTWLEYDDAVSRLHVVIAYCYAEGYPDPTAARAIKAADRPPEEIIMFRKMIKALSVICHVRVLGKVTLVDKKGRRW